MYPSDEPKSGDSSQVLLFKIAQQGQSNTGSASSIATSTAATAAGVGAPGDAAASSDAGSFSLISLFKRLLQFLTGVANTARTSIFTARHIYTSVVSFSRPSNTTAYNAGDVVGAADVSTPANAGSAVLSFLLAGGSGERTAIVKATLRIDRDTVPSGLANFRLHLYSAQPTAILDNAVFNLVAADRAGYLGYIDLITPEDMGDTLFTQFDGIRDFKLADATTQLWGELETRGGYTPASGTVHTITIHAESV